MIRKSLGRSTLFVLTMSVPALTAVPALAQYMSTPPPGQTSPPQPGTAPAQRSSARADSLTITAKNGQAEKQQWADRYECHKWAKDQSGFDPTQRPPEGVTTEEINSRRDQYRRAFTACLEGRGYTVQYGQPPSPAAPPAAAAPLPAHSHWVPSEPELSSRAIQGQVQGGYTGAVGHSDNLLDDGTNVGFGFTWFPTASLPIGLRVDGSYSSFRGRDAFLNQFAPNVYHAWQDIYGADVDLQLDLAHASPRSKLYLVGGAGWYRERTTLREIVYETGTFCGFYTCDTGTFAFRATDHETSPWRGSWNAGLGWEMAFADGGSVFFEARYRQINPRDDRTQLVPINVGLRF